MNIMILGNELNIATLIKKLANEQSVTNIYTTMSLNFNNKKIVKINVENNDINSYIKFAKENKILYTIILDKELLLQDASRKFALEDLLVFSPDSESYKVCRSKSTIKKLAYKLKIPTPKFGVYDKEYQAINAIRDFKFPIVIKSDDTDFYKICYTFSEAKDIIDKLFFNDYKRIVIEQYIEGEYFSFYVVSDGYDVIPFGAAYSYVNSSDINDVVNIFPYSNIDEEIESKIASKFIFPIIDEFNSNENVFLGILGLDFIMTPNKKLYLIGINNFFKKFDAQSIINATDMELSQLFLAASMFSLRDKFDFIDIKDRYFSSFTLPQNKQTDEDIIVEKYNKIKIACISSATMNGLNDKIMELYGV